MLVDGPAQLLADAMHSLTTRRHVKTRNLAGVVLLAVRRAIVGEDIDI